MIATAAASGAPSCPEAPTAARKAWMWRFHTIAAASSGGGKAAGEAARTIPVPGAIRPVPNRLFMVSAHTTALP